MEIMAKSGWHQSADADCDNIARQLGWAGRAIDRLAPAMDGAGAVVRAAPQWKLTWCAREFKLRYAIDHGTWRCASRCSFGLSPNATESYLSAAVSIKRPAAKPESLFRFPDARARARTIVCAPKGQRGRIRVKPSNVVWPRGELNHNAAVRPTCIWASISSAAPMTRMRAPADLSRLAKPTDELGLARANAAARDFTLSPTTATTTPGVVRARFELVTRLKSAASLAINTLDRWPDSSGPSFVLRCARAPSKFPPHKLGLSKHR